MPVSAERQPEPHGPGLLPRWPGRLRGLFSWRGWRWLLPVIAGLLALAAVAVLVFLAVVAYVAYEFFSSLIQASGG